MQVEHHSCIVFLHVVNQSVTIGRMLVVVRIIIVALRLDDDGTMQRTVKIACKIARLHFGRFCPTRTRMLNAMGCREHHKSFALQYLEIVRHLINHGRPAVSSQARVRFLSFSLIIIEIKPRGPQRNRP